MGINFQKGRKYRKFKKVWIENYGIIISIGNHIIKIPKELLKLNMEGKR